MPSATATPKSTRVKAHSVTLNIGESVVTIRKGDRATLATLGPKLIAAMRRRRRGAGAESASEGLRAIREGR